VGQSFYVTTDAEVYIMDKEYVTTKEARQWYKRRFYKSQTAFYISLDAPPLSLSIETLIDRVNNIDKDSLRLDLVPDHHLMAKHDSRKNFRIGNRALAILKQLTGISAYKSNRNNNNVWNNFKKKWTKRNGTEQKKRLYYSEEKDDNSQQPR